MINTLHFADDTATRAEPSTTQKRDRTGSQNGATTVKRKRQKSNQSNKAFDFISELHAPEHENAGPAAAHRFEVRHLSSHPNAGH